MLRRIDRSECWVNDITYPIIEGHQSYPSSLSISRIDSILVVILSLHRCTDMCPLRESGLRLGSEDERPILIIEYRDVNITISQIFIIVMIMYACVLHTCLKLL